MLRKLITADEFRVLLVGLFDCGWPDCMTWKVFLHYAKIKGCWMSCVDLARVLLLNRAGVSFRASGWDAVADKCLYPDPSSADVEVSEKQSTGLSLDCGGSQVPVRLSPPS